MFQDFRYAVRILLTRPGFALTVVLTLALGLGASTVMFSLLDAAILRPLPFDRSERLVFLWGVAGPDRTVRGGSFPEVADWRTMNRTLTDVALYDNPSLNLRLGSEAVRVQAEMVSAQYFDLLGARASLGRTFTSAEDRVPGEHPVVVISDALWRRRLGASPGILERTVYLNDRPCRVVGVMPPAFAGISFDTEVWIPSMMVSLTSSPEVVTDRGTRWLGAVARLRDGVSLEQAQGDLDRVAAALESQHPGTNRQRGVLVRGMQDSLLGSTRALVLLLFAAVLLFLTVACANVASLQLARTTARRRELAVRAALGARRSHVLRQLFTESLVLAGCGSIVGAIVAAWTLPAVLALMPDGALPGHVQPAIDLRALLFTAAVTLVTGAAIAVLPVLVSGTRDLGAEMKHGARGPAASLGSLRRLSPQQLLVVAEIAVAMTLLTAAGLLAQSLGRQLLVPIGFDPEGVTVARLTLPSTRYPPEQRAVFVNRLDEELRQVPGVGEAAIGSDVPFTGNTSASVLALEGAPESTVRFYRHFVTPAFFSTLDMRIVRGRAFTPADRRGAPPVAMINESGARRLWRSIDVVGRRVVLGTQVVEIVGVVADARFRSVTASLAAAGAEPDLFFPYPQRTDRDIAVAVRARDGATVPLQALQQAVDRVDPTIPLYQAQRLQEAVDLQTASSRFGTMLLGAFSGGALLLAAIGLYGLVSYVTGLSRREIAIRLALGARGGRVALLILRNGLALVLAGIGVGSLGALAAGASMQRQLFETRMAEPVVYAAVAVTLFLVAAVASFVPARRAVSGDPQLALRGD